MRIPIVAHTSIATIGSFCTLLGLEFRPKNALKPPPMTLAQVTVGGYQYWIVEFRYGKKRFRRYFKTEAEAKRYAKQVQRDFDHAKAVLEELTAPERIRVAEAVQLAKKHRIDLLECVREAIRKPQIEQKRLEAAIESFLEAKKLAGVRPQYLRQIKWVLTRFLAQIAVEFVDEVDLEILRAFFRQQKWKAPTRRSVLIDLRTFFEFCKTQNWVRENVARKLELPRFDEKAPEILSVQEAKVLLKTVKEDFPRLIGYLTIGLFAGLRPAELDRLSWQDVWLHQKVIHVRGRVAKTRRRRLVTIQPVLSAWLEIADQSDIRPTNFDRQWKALKRKAGVKWAHDILRHTFASYHLAYFKNPALTAHEMGHRDQEMLYRHYRELVTPTEAQEFWNLSPEIL